MKILAIETSCDDTCVAVVQVLRQAQDKPTQRRPAIPCFNVLSNVISSQTKIHKEFGGVVPTLAKREHEKNLVFVLQKALSEAGAIKNKKLKIPPSLNSYERAGPPSLRWSYGGASKNKKHKEKIKNIQKIFKREPLLLESFINFTVYLAKPKIDLIAVTHGPGLEPALWAGVNFARALSYWWKIPLLGVDHMEGHIAANFLPQISSEFSTFQFSIFKPDELFPAICLAVSGGHTQLILVKDINKYELVGETVDDAAGEGFDKVARLLGLGFPGGPEISCLAKQGDPKTFNFSRPMINSGDYNFSFSGLKTSVLYQIKKLTEKKLNEPLEESDLKKISKKTRADIAASFQQAAVDVLISKTIKAAKNYGVKTVMLAGGVAANEELRKQLGEKISAKLPDTRYQIPDTRLATDNAAMIGAAAYFRKNKASLTKWKTLKADGNLRIR